MNRVANGIVAFLEYVADHAPAHTGRGMRRMTAVVIILLLLCALVVYMTGGTGLAYLHLIYLPVIVASLTIGLLGGLLTALAGGLLVLGPLMPLDVGSQVMQQLPNVLFRTSFLVLVALITGAFGASVRRRRTRQELAERQLRQLYARNLRLFATLVSKRDRETAGHCGRVAHNCAVLGRVLGLEERELRNLYWAGMLHDVGKLAVPEAILQKPARLTPEEFETVKQHSNVGAEFLTQLSATFEPIAEGVRWHHERWDGSGYPDGLKETGIPLSARILAAVDVFEAVTSERPYHSPMTRDEARAVIREGAGSHFDPAVAAAFLELEAAGKIIIQGNAEPLYEDVAGTESEAILRLATASSWG